VVKPSKGDRIYEAMKAHHQAVEPLLVRFNDESANLTRQELHEIEDALEGHRATYGKQMDAINEETE
jgi:hypothetical protein